MSETSGFTPESVAVDQDMHSKMLKALLDAAVDAIVTADHKGIIQSINSSACELFGYKSSNFIGKNVSILMPEPWASAHDQYLENYNRTGVKNIIGSGREVSGLKSDGSVFPMHISITEYEVAGEKHFTAIIHDISFRKKTEQALDRSQKMEAIGQLTGGIAHDFNNLLTVITGNLELLDMQLEDDFQKGLIKEAIEASEMGADLTTRLLAFAKRSVLKPEVFNLNALVKSMMKLLARTLGEDISVETSLDTGLWNTLVDPGQIESVILNLAVNARDAMTPDGGRLFIETTNVEFDSGYVEHEIALKAGKYVCIAVSDNGCGMSEEVHENAFEPFFTTKETGKGTGLGLSMVFGFAKQSGGHATIYSEPGLGTTVNVYLPKYEGEKGAGKPGSGALDEIAMGRGELVLVVEDDMRIQKITKQRLEQLNYQVLTADDGEHAIEMLKKTPDIGLVFTDLVMPGSVSGYDLVKHVHDNFPSIATLMTSGYAEDLVSKNNLNDSHLKLLRKPYRQLDLSLAVREALQSVE